jgi:hypothetical protein
VALGTAPDVTYGIRIGSQNGTSGLSNFTNAIYIYTNITNAINTSAATVSGHAILLAGGQKINFSSSATRTLRYEPAATAFRFATGAAVLFEIADDATVRASGNITILGTQVVAARRTGYTVAMTGTANRATAYATSTVTLEQLAERVKAIQDDLSTHGLLGV